jgi:undecaprenyl-diphosphatase
MSLALVLLLALVQGVTELLPVSSSAHVILVERLFGLDPSAPEMTFLLVMLHTGTMLAVLARYWARWRALVVARAGLVRNTVVATGVTGVVGLGLKALIEKVVLAGTPHAEVEHLFGNLPLVAGALLGVGVLITVAGVTRAAEAEAEGEPREVPAFHSAVIGLVQGLCLPFRGFSRSGATISTALLLGERRGSAEDLSFALAVALTPAAIGLELHRLIKATAGGGLGSVLRPETLAPGLLGSVASFGAGLLALKLLSSALEQGRWRFFGYYCFAFAGVVLAAHFWLPAVAAS